MEQSKSTESPDEPPTEDKYIFNNNLYLRDVVYWKDFRYLNPEVVRGRENNKQMNVGAKRTARDVLKMWYDEVFKGVRQFLYEGSLHGVKYIFEPSFSRSERLAWVVIVVVSVSVCVVNMLAMFQQWASAPFVNVMDSLQTPVWAVPFPSVVLCPHLHVKMSCSNISALNEMESFYASLICPKMFRMNKATRRPLSLDQTRKLQEFIVRVSPKCQEVVRRCYWKPTNDQDWLGKDCCESLFRPVFTNYGLCYAFNRLPLNGMTNITANWQRVFDKHVFARPLAWTLDDGYPRVFPPDPTMRPFRAMASGEVNGLGVEVYLNTSEHQFECDDVNLGYTVLIGSPTDHIYTSTVLRLPMGRWTTVEVSPVTYRTDPALRSLSPGRRQCFFQDERTLDYYSIYTDSNCKHDLLMRESKKQCNCVLFNWPRTLKGEPICSTEIDFRCINEVHAKVEEQLIYAYYEDSSSSHGGSGARSCYPSCNDILYNNQVYYSDMKVEGGEGGEVKELEITKINVHFYDDMFIGLHRHAQYDGGYFAGAIGGLLSLFLGFSIISVAELIYFVVFRPVYTTILSIFCEKRPKHLSN
ncbi:unnamed protein product [Plutella xylostella]|uniref:(diamondback moth) hypothetical protein n=1 Tax=Plutella xylostella TaxID=51655 RepID=A0A8S4G7Q2_PLUXY|nr:unnamed protein product [Plutella xylostella]